MPRVEISLLQLSDRHLQLLQKILAQTVPEADVWAYGSRVTGGSHEGSDLDLVLRFPVGIEEQQPKIMSLKEAVQESMLPMLVDVHLWSQLPESFHNNIQAAYVVVQSSRAL